ncbi:MAG TPA: hypothetical protein VF017_16975 [Thermoanaerobaculia bacterium]|nr:hypothetical protein [Thermoanaerobaculia bacterium]
MKRALALLLLAGLALATAAADYRQAYLDALRALRRGAAAEAARLLEAAVAERPQEAARARLVGAIPEPYLPQHYLGLARSRLGDCPGALAALSRSREQGVVAAFPERLAEAAAVIRTCEERQPPAPSAAPQEPKPAELPPAAAPSEKEPAETAAPDHRPESSPAAVAAEPPLLPPPAPATPPATEPPPLPPLLTAAMAAYFNGEYGLCLAKLGEAGAPADRRQRFLAALFGAACRHGLYLVGGEEDEELLERAIADLATARRERPAFAPHPDFFSPRFIDFFRDHPP